MGLLNTKAWEKASRRENYFKRVRGEGRWDNNKRKKYTYVKSAIIFSKYCHRNHSSDPTPCINPRRTIYLHCSPCHQHPLSPASATRTHFIHRHPGLLSIHFSALIFLPKMSSFQVTDIIQCAFYFTSPTIFQDPSFHWLAFRIPGPQISTLDIKSFAPLQKSSEGSSQHAAAFIHPHLLQRKIKISEGRFPKKPSVPILSAFYVLACLMPFFHSVFFLLPFPKKGNFLLGLVL